MKKIVLVVIASLFFANVIKAQNPQLESIFEQYSDKKSFTYVYVNGSVNSIIPSHISNSISTVNFTKILTYNGNVTDTIAKRVVTKIKGVLKSQNFELLVQVKDAGDKVETYQKISDLGTEMILIIKDTTDLTIMWVYGKANTSSKSSK